ncbi:MAG: purine-nucleoside phosphorylase [Deltaproteobacteria bacterium]|nr:purine-nucleoside phosphorylase [Deltaproteobacteria bacterium]
MSSTIDQLDICLRIIQERTDLVPEIGLVLGSGLGFLAERVDSPTIIGYGEMPGFPVSTVEGHASRLVLGQLGGRNVVVMQGRFHYYEGYPMERIAIGIRLFARLGAKMVFITNAAGGISQELKPGDLMLISDHLNLMGDNPLIGHNPENLGPRFPDMSNAYNSDLREQAKQIAKSEGIELKEGVYSAMTGPSYETPAEIRMLKTIGADAIGMSTIPEAIAANHVGMRVLGISCISNLAAGISDKPLSHAEVKETANKAKDKFTRLLLALIGQLR